MLWLTLLAQGGAPALTPIEFPAGSAAAYIKGYMAWSEMAEKGKWADARKQLDVMPDGTVTVEWDDSAIPAALKPTYRTARDNALEAWTNAMPHLKTRVVPTGGEIKISFVDTLPPNADSPGPAGAVFFAAYAPGEPTIDAVLALKRGSEQLESTESDVYNEVLHSVALHFGVARIPGRIQASTRNEMSTNSRNVVSGHERSLINEALAVRNLAEAYQKAKRKPGIGKPELVLDQKKIELPKVVQGERIPFNIGLSNQGTGTLRYFVVPDCACVTLNPVSPLLPSGATGLNLSVNTEEFPGRHTKQVRFFTNDPDQPMVTVFVEFDAAARFRFLRQNETNTFFVPDDGMLDDLYLFVHPQMKWTLGEPQLAGREGIVALEPWKGIMADPELREPAIEREGYRIKILTSPDLGNGRFPMMVEIPTGDPGYPQLRYTFYAQRGIAAVPEQFFFGVLGAEGRTGSVLLTRPGQPFKVTKVESNHPRVRARAVPLPKGDFALEIQFASGPVLEEALAAMVTVHTDDPKQPKLEVRVTSRLP